MNQIKKFSEEFFKNLKCQTRWETLEGVDSEGNKNNILVVENVPKNFEDLFGKKSPYKISFVQGLRGCDFVGRGSRLLTTMVKFLENLGKATLLKIDFDCDPKTEIDKVISLKNCEINNIIKRHKNNFFSRFTFITTFRYVNKTEQIVSEIYVHDGKVVNGDLDGYTILEGEVKNAQIGNVKDDYKIALRELKNSLDEESMKIGGTLSNTLEIEISRIRQHYNNLLSELGGDLTETLQKINEVELKLRTADEPNAQSLKTKLNRLRNELVKIGKDDSRDKILREQKFTIKDIMQKYSLNIDNKLVNTTVIYYPIFNFDLFLKGDSLKRLIKMEYDPLTKTINKLKCELCGIEISQLNLCSSGHISCDDCFGKCGECGKQFCKKCLKKSCSVCGKKLCKNCSIMCFGCGKYVCSDHMRKDCVSGDERCVNCLRACMRCHGLSSEKYFDEAVDGSKICQKCIGKEKRNKLIGEIFNE